MKKIDISTKRHPNTFALIDNEDYNRMNRWKWYAVKRVNGLYAERVITIKNMKQLRIRMSREIMRYVGGKEVDHINHNSLDNQKHNLRLCTHSENNMNKTKQKNNTSGYKGVSLEGKKWRVRISKEGEEHYLGRFINKEDAAIAYNNAALKYHGEYAHLNIIKEVV